MMVPKAIEILESLKGGFSLSKFQDRTDALNLAIEALERHRNRDYIDYNGMHEKLPSETLPGGLAPHSQSTSYNP